jgi:hypothetical protein
MIIDRLQWIQQQHLDFTSTNCKFVYKHALNYCVNALVNRNKKDVTVTFPITHFMGDIEEDANTWKKQRLHQLFPKIFESKPTTVPSPSALPPTITQATTDPKEDETTRLLKAYLASQLQQQQTVKKDENEKCLGMCESEYEALLTYAGITNNDAGALPKLWHKLAEKNISKVGKANAARHALRNTAIKYREAKIKVTPSLLTMITTRAFEGELSSSKQEATKGLSPFALPPISNSELDDLIAFDNEIKEATTVSTSDIKKTKIILVEVDDYDELMRYMKEYANLLEVLFSQCCPLWLSMHDAIEKLTDYTAEERAALSRASCNAILWIIMRQSRAFAAGDMKEPEDATMEFREMMLYINIRRQIEFGGLPASMKKRKADTSMDTNKNDKRNNSNNNNHQHNNNNNRSASNTNNNNNNNSHQYNNNTNNNNNSHNSYTDKGIQNPKLAAAFKTIITQNRTPPQVYRITTYCGLNYTDLFRKRGMCTKAQLFGLCDKNCPHVHETISDGEAETVIRKLKRAIENPQEFKNRV